MTNNQTQPIPVITVSYNGKDITHLCFIQKEKGLIFLPTVYSIMPICDDMHEDRVYEENKFNSLNKNRQFLHNLYYNTMNAYISDKAFKKELDGEEAKQAFKETYNSFKNKVQKNIDCKKDWERPLSRLKHKPAKKPNKLILTLVNKI